MSAQAGWYPDPGGGQGLFRYWDGRAWSAATSPDPAAPAPVQNVVEGAVASGAGMGGYGAASGQQAYGRGYGQQAAYGAGSAYASYQQVAEKKRTPWGWWIAAVAVLAAITLVGVLVIRAFTGGGTVTGSPSAGGQGSANSCPPVASETANTPPPQPNDGRLHGGPVSVPLLGSPFEAPVGDNRVPFGRQVIQQQYTVETDYDGNGSSWVASVLLAELAAGDGFFTPEQGAKIVVRCVVGTFYGDAEVTRDDKKDEATTIDGREAWLVESQLSFDIPGLQTKGELLIVAIVNAGATSGLYYASIPDTTPELVEPAREALRNLRVDA